MPDPTDELTDLLQLDQQVCFPLYAASNLLTRLYRPVLAPFNLTYPQYLVMLVLWQESPKSVGELGQLLYLDSGTLTPLLKRLEQNGFILRQRDPADERRVLISLTVQGSALHQQAAVIPQTLITQLALSTSQLDTLRQHVRDMVAILHHQLNQTHVQLHIASQDQSVLTDQTAPSTQTDSPHSLTTKELP